MRIFKSKYMAGNWFFALMGKFSLGLWGLGFCEAYIGHTQLETIGMKSVLSSDWGTRCFSSVEMC